MSTSLNYYDELINEIEELIDNSNYNDALTKLKTELTIPYIPQNIEKKLETLLKEVNAKMLEQQPNPNSVWTLAKISEILTNPTDEETQLLAFHYLKDQNLRKILPVIRKYLVNKKVSNFAKIYLLYLLKEQEINEVFQVQKTNGFFKLNPQEMTPYQEEEQVKLVLQLLDQWVYNDNPSLYHTCLYLLETYYYDLYPQFIVNNEIEALAVAIIYQGQVMYNEKITIKVLAEQFDVALPIVQKYLLSLNNKTL
ncbi:DUF3196 family protein [Spiroplasma sp. hyd1]|uniref:DUF3196 family protein n=1 Tax=Spiroplasma sp. hyd1 TaxID=1609976 RepID=UPI0018DDC555|nr:DUF3196 family protein [Spiroplasma sp. hyd1]MBH8623285.1 DUF3196 domain-containing protein [Spiroplasma sp. hyd1]